MDKESGASQAIPTRYQKGMRRIFVFALVMGLILIAIPFGIQYGIVKGLSVAGSKQVKVEDVDFNPFTGLLAVKKLQVITGHEPEFKFSLLSIQMDWLPLFKKQILVRSILLEDAYLQVEQGKENELLVGGFMLPASEPEKKSEKDNASMEWGIGLEKVRFVNNDVEFKSSEFSTSIKIDDLSLARLFSWKSGQAADLSFESQVNSAPVSGELEIFAFADKPLFKGKLKVDQFVLDDFIMLAGGTLNELKGKLSTDLLFSLSVAQSQIDYHQQGLVSVQDFTLGMDDAQLAHQKLVWDGDINFVQSNGQIALMVTGDLALDKHQNSLKSPELDTKIESLQWNGELSLKNVGEKSDLKVKGDFSATGLNSQSRATKFTLLQLDKLTLEAILIDQPENIQLSKIVLDELTVAQNQPESRPLMKTHQIIIDKLQLQNLSDIDIETIGIDALVTDVNVNKEGELALLNELLDSLKPSGQQIDKEISPVLADQANQEEKATAIRVGEIKVFGESQVDFTTATISHSVEKKIRFKTFFIGEINSRTPEKMTPIELAAIINTHSQLSLDGGFSPFSKKTNGTLTVNLKAFELPEFSPLIRHELGYDIHSGQLDADIKIDIKQNILDGKIKIAAHKLLMEPADLDKVDKMAQQLAMPLDSALSLLRDKNDDIKLEIPIKGDIAKPDFDIGDAINTAMGNALQGTVKSYLKYALQPYGLIYMAAEKAYGVATSVSLEAVQFESGEQLLSDQSKQYMEKIGQLMQKRPGLRIRVCGFATPSDRLKLIELEKTGKQNPPKEINEVVDQLASQLLDLAKNRAFSVKSHLISTYKISPDRLFTCLPKVVKEVKQLPRVELLI